MPITFANGTGDGVTADLVQILVSIPDGTGAQTVTVAGRVQRVGLAAQAVSGTVTSPAVPGSGSVYWNVEVDVTSGALNLTQSTTGVPAVSGPNALIVFQQTLAAGSTGPSFAGAKLPDDW